MLVAIALFSFFDQGMCGWRQVANQTATRESTPSGNSRIQNDALYVREKRVADRR
jgi:hypothetical protein